MSELAFVGLAVLGGLGMYFAVGGWFELVYYRRRRDRPETWKCQPARWAPGRLRRHELLLGAANLTVASIVTGLLVARVAGGGFSAIAFELGPGGVPGAVGLTLAYFLGTDCALYWAHRLLHRPLAFRWIHRWHHRYTAPTAFTAMAMHPLELALYQGLTLAPLLVLPVHVAGVVVVLVYQNLVALVDHSGVRTRAWFPWQPPAQFHDDHHVHFHVNYGQTLGVWDRVFGTWRRADRRYGADVFGGKGAPVGPGSGPPRYVDYGGPAREPAMARRTAP